MMSKFNRIKITMEVVFILIILVNILVLTSLILATWGKHEQDKLWPEVSHNEALAIVIITAIILILNIAGLIGIITERKCMVIILVILVTLSIFYELMEAVYFGALMGACLAALTIQYIMLINDKRRDFDARYPKPELN
ncbi:unnamed protein product [Medioppia subpectinata]|uniref:Uncharacterized protein n=1 Tax=Medioppia subpectinata TaxID=1979941 RepID=A0A7R9KXL9_9ACAR|nr:unnamed protein product [Medioppia subpectinata]CAG2111389.1 unnamed protein product [Medioppia subpectinata]